MKYQLFSYSLDGFGRQIGISIGSGLYSLKSCAVACDTAVVGDQTFDQIIAGWSTFGPKLTEMVDDLYRGKAEQIKPLDASTVSFLPLFDTPGIIYGAGANYKDHVEAMAKAFNMNLETNPKAAGVKPWHFQKAGRSTLAAHEQSVTYPAHTEKLDYEAELAVLIGRTARFVDVDSALEYVAGYTCANDLSARDNLRRENVDPSSPFRFDWIGHKSFPGSCPLGAFFTPAEFIATPEDLDIKCWVNDELRQDSNTSNHLYSVADQIAYLSERVELYPGDIILTGTPAGVGMESGTFLKRGDTVRVWIESIGELQNTIK
ncbi:2-keto-4-pentenoate hydratase/2-oxohepta-3-ene-1,7-dioic acid hydratase (catechol pathway) [Paraburkholderia steynii]|uniref:2-keto-4-pentenoate hydratase/2-oxohepta-3-ene-1,7-dioic acid hydratase (Catechol pathway) n=1 Tax=Paraburkholderia steynii TaxID=1245441 RepID=A0A7Z7B6D6_9BURK|nr:fumarylacetoacetate hydrolase family protein [Paraburkholderia steynii]SDH25222.1 2-keto-4-pentenoate hydratase/2-oxohepta-3-ene-1,7-dioic acid hydratase (catechol pathway) [Paraburkholderia steynii]